MKKIQSKSNIQRICHVQRVSKNNLKCEPTKRATPVNTLKLEAKHDYERRLKLLNPQKIAERLVENRGVKSVLETPETLNLSTDYIPTLGYIMRMRALKSQRSGYVEFEKLNVISPAALIVLAAELDCCLGLAGINKRRKKPIGDDSHKWKPHIRAFFYDLGLFRLTGAAPKETYTFGKELHAVAIRRGKSQDGAAAMQLIKESLRLHQGDLTEERIYEGLGEALSNSLEHGYPHPYVSYPSPKIKCWWAGAIYDEDQNKTHFMVYDRGIGLPKTLPRNKGFKKFILSLGLTNPTDAEVIWAATQAPKSSTLLNYRGEGLGQMAEVVDAHPNSSLRIISGNGQMRYLGDGKKELSNLPAEFCGTLVEWDISHEN